ncbi:MAG: CDP-diacylglycerol---serine O-phosphatidyltransferase [Desulfovibrionales bacterium]|jgi:CDP-diacylglycerol--serine O-phosphatidyltransferase|nr:CDP-diacylglycerol---serine O-phosphatidyltransferase [Desulfovibrionales bacterium]
MNIKSKTIPRKGVYILPNLLTIASLFTGFLGLTWAARGEFESCAVAIFVSALFDGLDGKVARLTGASSDFGIQLDSLADLVAFGVTPAFMVYFWKLEIFGRLGLLACFLFAACGALRLARFNVQTKVISKKFFIGLPIPAAGCTLASLVLFAPYLPDSLPEKALPVAALVLAYALSFLMVSTVRYASFKDLGLVKAHPFSAMVTAILLFVLVASQPKLLGFLILLGYLASGLIYTLFVLSRRSARMLRGSSQDIS